jgi:hypothetical protein
VLIVPHSDNAGREAMRAWALQLQGAGVVRPRAFDLGGLTLVDGTVGKDLSDTLKISPDCWESAEGRKFQGVLP